jgi:hypothetical protein
MFVRFVCAIVCPYAFVFPFVPSRLPTISLGEDALRAWGANSATPRRLAKFRYRRCGHNVDTATVHSRASVAATPHPSMRSCTRGSYT